MGISKAWILKKIEDAQSKHGAQVIEIEGNEDYWHGVEHGLKECFNELTSAPVSKKLTKVDANKGYDSILAYYISKGYTKEHANEIAMKCIKDQQQKVLENS